MSDVVLLAWLLTLVRIASTVAFLAPFSNGPVPRQVKVGLAVALTLVWAPDCAAAALPGLTDALASTHAGWWLGWLSLRESLTGLAIAWVLGLLFVPLRIAGAYIGQEMGLTLGGLSSPVDQQPSDVVTQLVEALGILTFFVFNLHHLVLIAMRRTFELFPIGGEVSSPGIGWIVRCVSGAERAGFQLAGPVGVGLFLLLVVTLLISRTVPQINLLSFGMPARVAVGLALLLACLPHMLQRFAELVQHAALP